jgi:flavin reductase
MKQASIDPAAELALDECARQLFRNAMALLGAAVNIVTTDGPGGKAGFAATAICSVTDSPPTLLVCLNQKSSVYETFTANQVLCVNVLAPGHERLARLFGGKTHQNERFRAASWHPLSTSSPALVDALASFDCRITHSVPVGTHDVLFGRVVDIQVSASRDGLVYFCRDYHRLPTKTDGVSPDL